MALLIHELTGKRLALAARTLVGRSASVALRLTTDGVSGEHAVLRWTRDGWTVRDLGSLNGTWVDGKRIDSGAGVAIARGARLVFGAAKETWILESDGRPDVMAERDGEFVHGDDGLLALPSLEEPLLLIEKHDDVWMISGSDGPEPIADGTVVTAGGMEWTVVLPAKEIALPLPSTKRIGTVMEDSVERAALMLAVSGDREYIEPTVTMNGEEHPIPPKAHHELLLVLAQSRMEDAASDPSAEGEHGWVYTSDLRTMLGVSPNQFYVMCHRCRREFKALGFPDAANIVERRSTSRQVRIGIKQLSVRAL